MTTDDPDLNRAVAEARGHMTYTGHTAHGDIPARYPDICTDPAAWGALFTEIKAAGLVPAIAALYDEDAYMATINMGRDGVCFEEVDPRPGRALALVYLKAMGKI